MLRFLKCKNCTDAARRQRPRAVLAGLVIALAMMIASAVALAEGIGDLAYGMTNDAIRAMQDRLIELKYFSGESTGHFGDKTKTAVKNFQIANGLEATGIVNEETVAKLKSEDAVSKTEYLASVSSTSSNKNDVLMQVGSEGEEVMALQKLLISLGYATGEPSGRYGRVTQAAVMAFQKANQLKDTGSVDTATYELMRSGNALSRQEAEARKEREEKSDEEVFLKPGDSGSNVGILQKYLLEYGYYAGEIDSEYSDIVEAAVKEFQKENALSQSGVVDINMRNLLISGDVVYESNYQKTLSVQPVKFGDKGIAVKLLQTRLKALGYYSGKIDGIFSTATQTAVTLFQKVHDLETTGIADQTTRIRINAESAVPYLQIKGAADEIPVFKYGMASDHIATLQSYLYGHGYYFDVMDGIFGSNMLAAVKKFQVANGLEVTGEIDETTRITIMSEDAVDCETYDAMLATMGANMNAGALEDASDEEEMRRARVEFVCHMALEELEKPYQYGAVGPDFYDGSGFVQYLYGQIGLSIARSVEKQGYGSSHRITEQNLQRDDLVFFNTESDDDLCDEVGIYLGEGQFIHASRREGRVVISAMDTGYYAEKYSWGIRPLR